MPGASIQVEDVWKKFHRGEFHDSLRDLIPAAVRRVFHGAPQPDELAAGDFWALRGLSFEVRAGEAVGVIGPNGAGKSTVLKLLNRILRPTRGTIAVRGRVGALIEIAAGFHPDLTGRENTYLQGAILGMTRREISRRFDEIVAFAEIEEFIDTPVKRYSSGMNARLGFSIATSFEQEILLIDEVLSVGDWAFQQKCTDRMSQLTQSGAAVVFVSHNLRAVTDFCGHAILLEHGRTAAAGPPDTVVRTYLRGAARPSAQRDHPVASLTQVTVRNRDAEAWSFAAGEEAWVDVEVTAHQPCSGMAVVIFLQDERAYQVFNISTARLGMEAVALDKGQTWACSFRLTMHLARGAFLLGVSLKRYDTGTVYDAIFPAATLHITSTADVRGSANLYPSVVETGVS
jgi:ABC-type polysaccharide/polyol phosphate transport system ATPase subunit